MLLAIDVGNTLTNFGIFQDDELKGTFKTESISTKSIDEYDAIIKLFFRKMNLSEQSIDKAIISSVVPSLTRVFVSLSEKLFMVKPIVLGPKLHSGLQLKVDNPSEVGSDLVSDAIGGISIYGYPLFIADLGTANKYLYIDEDGAFAGLSIAPGLAISMDALVNKTAALPEVSLNVPSHVMGKNTRDCMNSGITYGTAYQVRGFAENFERESGKKLKMILTGGNAIYVKDILNEFVYDETLLLKGLKEIAKRREK